MIPVQGQPAMRAVMPANVEALAYLLFAAIAPLACATGINFHDLNTGAFSLLFEDAQESGPTGILDRTGKPAVPEHPFDVQAFRSDKSVATDQVQRNLMAMMVPQVANAAVQFSETFDRLASVLAAFLFPGHGAAKTTKFGECFFVKPWIRLLFTFAGGQKVFQANVDPNGRIGTRLDGDFTEVTRQDDIPLVGFTLNPDSLDFAFVRPVDIDLDGSDELQAEAVPEEFRTVPVYELNTIELVFAFEPRVSCRFTFLDTIKECGKRKVKAAHRKHSASGVNLGKERIGFSEVLEP
jgi:hypothetical protein